jgi:plastocyanin
LCVVVVALLAAVPAPAARAAAQTWTVLAGGSTKDFAVISNAYHPRTIDIAVGDTVSWLIEGFHNIAFLGGQPYPPIDIKEGDKTYFNPRVFFPVGGNTYDGSAFVNSGVPPQFPKPMSYSLTFPKAGTYPYVCTIHGPGMGGTVNVRERASSTPAAVLRQARAEQAATIKAGVAALAALKVERKGTTVTVPMIGDLKRGYTLLRFAPAPITVARGTTVTWTMRDPFEIHTITFTSGQKPPRVEIPEPQAQGPPKLLVNPKAAAPTMTKTYAGTGYVNSGILFPPGVPGNPPTSYSLTFTRAGRYEYWCVVHVPEGMKGTIIVR